MRHCEQFNKRVGQKGSITIEASVCLVVVTFFILFLISFIQYAYVHVVAQRAVISVSQKFGCYSSVFYKSGLSSLSDNMKNRLLRETGVLDNESLRPVVSIADVAFESIDSSLYNAVITQMINDEINNNRPLFSFETVSMAGSEYFNDKNGFILNVRFRTELLVPIDFLNLEGYDIVITARGNCWTSGANSEYNVKDIQVWELDNFRRGRVLEKVFGSNLPEMFPVIDIYNKEEKYIALIASIDHTKKTYLKKGAITKTVDELIDDIYSFERGECEGVSVKKGDYKSKKIILVMPRNTMTVKQAEELALCRTDAAMKGVSVEVEYYQVSRPA